MNGYFDLLSWLLWGRPWCLLLCLRLPLLDRERETNVVPKYS